MISGRKKKLALFDLDGTITFRDTFMDFIMYSIDPHEYRKGMSNLMPSMFAYMLKRLSNHELKERFLTRFFGGWSWDEFSRKGNKYGSERLPHLIRSDAIKQIRWHLERKHQVCVVSGSISEWISGWCTMHNILPVCNEMITENGRITGKIKNPNCYGSGKVERIRRSVNLEEFEYIFAYGNSRGDREMLEMADERGYRVFKLKNH